MICKTLILLIICKKLEKILKSNKPIFTGLHQINKNRKNCTSSLSFYFKKKFFFTKIKANC